MQGGHSGIDINKGRGNAVRILGRVLQTLMGRMPLSVAAINGGSKRNAIPREASATVVINTTRQQEMKSLVAAVEAHVQSDLGAFDAGLRITLKSVPHPPQVLEDAVALAIAGLLASQHH